MVCGFRVHRGLRLVTTIHSPTSLDMFWGLIAEHFRTYDVRKEAE